MEKSAEAFRTISEVAEELAVPKHVLRFWEGKFTHIKPMKRGGGRRYYRPEDVELLRGIRQLLHEEGYTIKGVQKQIRQSGVEFVKAYGKSSQIPAALSVPVGASLPVMRKAEAASKSGLGRPQELALAETLKDLEACRKLVSKLA
jgi:DNA-binding transcriptional MerR regulator